LYSKSERSNKREHGGSGKEQEKERKGMKARRIGGEAEAQRQRRKGPRRQGGRPVCTTSAPTKQNTHTQNAHPVAYERNNYKRDRIVIPGFLLFFWFFLGFYVYRLKFTLLCFYSTDKN
jgi:hypothetical protein